MKTIILSLVLGIITLAAGCSKEEPHAPQVPQPPVTPTNAPPMAQ